MKDCIFCNIINGSLPSDIVYENDAVFVIKDIAPKAPIHYLIIPKKHLKDVTACAPEDLSVAGSMGEAAQYLAANIPHAEDYRLVINNGYKAGQRVFHLHMHFLAGRESDDL